jgi:hypothetical protein
VVVRRLFSPRQDEELAMHRYRTIALGLWAAALVFAVAAAPLAALSLPTRARFALEAELSEGFGRSAYDLSVPIGTDVLMSRLEFPLDGVQASLHGLYSQLRTGEEIWRFELSGALGISDPICLMRDYDWVKPAGYPPIPFSYTESSVEAISASVSLRAARVFFVRGPVRLSVAAGYRFAYLFQSIRGYKGWQYVWNDTAGAYDLYLIQSYQEAVRYTLYSHAVPLGVALRFAPAARLAFAMDLAYLPVYALDEDDHLLRNKLSTSSGIGHGLEGRLALLWRPGRAGRAPGGAGLYLSCSVEGLLWFVSTTQTQRWYGDDPSAPGDETGMVLPGIDHHISNLELRAGIGVGFRF